VLAGITVAWLTNLVLFFTHPSIIEWACPGPVNSHAWAACDSPHVLKMVWVFACAGVVGAAAGAIGTTVLLRHRARLLDSSSPPLSPTFSR
jgi:hypothetical protein